MSMHAAVCAFAQHGKSMRKFFFERVYRKKNDRHTTNSHTHTHTHVHTHTHISAWVRGASRLKKCENRQKARKICRTERASEAEKKKKKNEKKRILRILIRASQLFGKFPKVYTWRSTRDYFDGIIYNRTSI